MPGESYTTDTAGAAIENIEFAEFITKIFSNISETLLHNNFEQMEAYTKLFGEVSKGLITYINDTENDISSEEILQYLQNLPPLPSTAESEATVGGSTVKTAPTTDIVGALPDAVGGAVPVDAIIKLGGTALDMINDKLKIPGSEIAAIPNTSSGTTNVVSVKVDDLYSAVAKKIAQGRYSVLETMVRMGVVRTVLDEATFGFHFVFHAYENLKDDYQRTDKFKNKTVVRSKTVDKTGPLFNLFKKHKEKTVSRDKQITINTVKERHLNNRGSNVSIMAHVNIRMRGESMALSG